MPILKNPRREAFAQGLAMGKSQTQAYKDAGFSPNGASGAATNLLKQDASIMLRRDEVLARRDAATERALVVNEAQIVSEARESGLTRASHLAELARLRDRAAALGQYGSAIVAERCRGQVMGYYIERSETGKPGDFKRDAQALKTQMEERLASIATKQALEKAAEH